MQVSIDPIFISSHLLTHNSAHKERGIQPIVMFCSLVSHTKERRKHTFVVFYSISLLVIFCLLINLHSVYGSYTDRKVPLRSVQTVRIVKTFTRSSGNEMQLSDCIRTENSLYDPYGSSGCVFRPYQFA